MKAWLTEYYLLLLVLLAVAAYGALLYGCEPFAGGSL